MKTVDEARDLAKALSSTSKLVGLNTRLAITDMDQPLGRTVGNALEVEEAAMVLTGNEPSRFCELCLRLAALTLVAAEATWDLDSGYDRAREALVSGAALLKAQSWFEAQGADPTILVRPDLLTLAPVRRRVHARAAGWISEVHAETVGQVAVELGAGRMRKEDPIDPGVGIEVHVEIGSEVVEGKPVFTIHARDEAAAERAERELSAAVRISADKIEFRDPVIEIVEV
jgi:thymidine phosphorylase